VAVNYNMTTSVWVYYPIVIPVNAKDPAGLSVFQVYTVEGNAQISSTALAKLLAVDARQLEMYNLCSRECQFMVGDVLLIPRNN